MRLIDADYAIEQIQSILYVEDCRAAVPLPIIKALVCAALKSEGVTPTIKDRWISTKDGLPSRNKVYLITLKTTEGPQQVMEAYLDYGGTWWRGNVSLINEYVTHWMPLPKMPEEESHGNTET